MHHKEQEMTEKVTDYKHTKIVVDLVDQLCPKYNVARNTRRYPNVVFYYLLHISGKNALSKPSPRQSKTK